MPTLLIRVDQATGGPSIAFRGVNIEASREGWNEDNGPVQMVDPRHELFERAQRVTLRQAEDEVATIGRELWDLVFEGEAQLGDWWRALGAQAKGTVRTALHVGVDALRAVPWELLTPPGHPPVFRQADAPWVRAYKTPWDFPEPITIPTQLLVLVGADFEKDEVDPELVAIYRALRGSTRRWNIEILDQPAGPLDIRKRYGEVKPDIVHFIGHGREIDGERGLWMQGPDSPWLLTPSLIGDWPLPPPRLVVLNACRSAAEEERDAAWSAVDGFVQRGAAAVIAMQGDVDAVSAVAFSRTLYEQLEQGEAIDAAVAEARYAVSANYVTGKTDEVSWVFPTLTVQADPDLLLPIGRSEDDPLAAPPYAEAALRVAHCVDRAVERRVLWSTIDPAFNKRARSLCLVSGEEAIGKSALVLSSLLTLRLRDRNVVYVDMERYHTDIKHKLSWLTVLRAVRDAIWDEGWLPAASGEHRDRFNHELNFLLQQKDPPPWTKESRYTDPGVEYRRAGEQEGEWIERMFESFVGNARRRVRRRAAPRRAGLVESRRGDRRQ